MQAEAVNAPKKQIVAIGGALSQSHRAAQLLYGYALEVSGKKLPRVLFINNATGDKEHITAWNFRTLAGHAYVPSELTFFDRTPGPANLRKLILSQDVILVCGGNTKSMLAVWHAYGIPELLREAWEQGIVLAGSSAGAICWFEQCLTDSYADEYAALDCLGFLPGSCCPHFNGDKERPETYHRLIRSGQLLPGIAIDERVAVHFLGERIYRVISAEAKACAYQVRLPGEQTVQKALRARHIIK
jgi:dipeptidase E